MTFNPTPFTGSTSSTNMNDCPSLEESCIDYIVSLCVVGSAFIISEVLPFLRSHEGNGLTDCLIKTFQTSECCLSKMIECLTGEKKENQGDVHLDTKLTSQQETEMKNSININIGDVKRTETEQVR